MLAFMPQSPTPPEFHIPSSEHGNTMSLTLLPSAPQSHTLQNRPSLLPASPSASKRPKLTLTTSSAESAFGKRSTSLRLETLSATSPTSRNTFRNGQDQDRTLRGKSKKPALTPLSTNFEATSTETPTPSNVALPNSPDTSETPSPSATSASSVSTLDSLNPGVPYRLPFNVQSILRNGPLPQSHNPRLSFSQSRPMFPAPKKVAFRVALTEEIKTTKYIWRNADIDTLPEECNRGDAGVDDHGVAMKAETTNSPLAGTKRHSPGGVDDDDETCPATPMAGRSKRRREWVWTLGPIQNQLPEEAKTVKDNTEGMPSHTTT